MAKGFAVRRDNNWNEGSSGVIGDPESRVIAWFRDEEEADRFIENRTCKVYSYVKIKDAQVEDYVTDRSIHDTVIAWFDSEQLADDYTRNYMRSNRITGYKKTKNVLNLVCKN